MEILEKPALSRIRILGYGDSASGKTALFTALPWGTPEFGEQAIYVAWDKTSEALESIDPADKKRLIVVVPTPNAKGVFDPHAEAHAIARYNYAEKYPLARTIILDGGSEMADHFLRAYANTGVFASEKSGDKHLTVGSKGAPDYMALPMMGDYGAAVNGVMSVIERLFMQPMNLIFLCQSMLDQPEGSGVVIGGPVLVGGKSINKVHSKFNTVVRCECVSTTKPDASGKITPVISYKAYTEQKGVWKAKLRKPISMPNPIPEVDVTGNPKKFWTAFMDARRAMGITGDD